MPASYDVDPSQLGRLTCASLTVDNEGETVELNGWVNRRRDLGGLIFIDLRDRFGITQIIFNPEIVPAAHEIASSVRNEYVLKITGIVRRRAPETVNARLKTGTIEIEAHQIEILNASLTPPFYINEDVDVDESLRLQHRYLDLRRPAMQQNLILRHEIARYMREFLYARAFVEVETPMLIKSTPEGARDFLVPSSSNPGMILRAAAVAAADEAVADGRRPRSLFPDRPLLPRRSHSGPIASRSSPSSISRCRSSSRTTSSA